MAYELRIGGKAAGTFETAEAAMEAAKQALLADADAEPEVFDTVTGRPAAPGASKGWREHLATKTGF